MAELLAPPAVMTPREIVSELDRYIVGQHDAKRAVAIALRNRWRRQKVAPDLRDEIAPKNILMIGPTGVGKTEIARRLARLAQAPFIKVEASRYTEVGYVGRDVESIVRDLVDASLNMLRDSSRREVKAKAEAAAEERLIAAMVGDDAAADTKSKWRRKLRDGELQTNTEGMLPEASLVFLDELLNANSAILNSLLVALNDLFCLAVYIFALQSIARFHVQHMEADPFGRRCGGIKPDLTT